MHNSLVGSWDTEPTDGLVGPNLRIGYSWPEDETRAGTVTYFWRLCQLCLVIRVDVICEDEEPNAAD